MKTIQPRKQRKRYYNAPLHKKQKWLASHLSENLLLKYDKRSIPLVKGDTVKVMRGSYRGHEDKVVSVSIPEQYVHIEGLTLVKADGTKIPKPMNPSNLLIIKLNLTDSWRRKKLERGLSESVKKEIEEEAVEQIKQVEEEQKRREEELLAEEQEPEIDEPPLDEIIEEPQPPAKPAKKPEEKPPAKEKKPASKPKKISPKPSEKPKETTKKKPQTKTTKKSPSKTPAKPKKKEETK